MKLFRLVLLLLLACIVLNAQRSRSSHQRPRGQSSSSSQTEQEPLASLQGTLKAVLHSAITVELEDGNSVDTHTSKKTRYYAGDKEIKRQDLKVGQKLVVETRHAPDLSLDAVNVRVQTAQSTPK